MRVRDLKRYLMKIGVSKKEVDAHLDKTELVAIGDEFWLQQRSIDTQCRVMACLLLLGVLWWAFVFRKKIYSCVVDVVAWLRSFFYQIELKVPGLKFALRKRLYVAVLCLSATIALDVYMMYVQMSVLASWVLPTDSAMNRYSARVPALSVTPAALLGSGGATAAGGFGLNVGPVIALWVCRYTKSYLE
ncbi:unnamed protein product, partial [Ectocarpus fasciculatus]